MTNTRTCLCGEAMVDWWNGDGSAKWPKSGGFAGATVVQGARAAAGRRECC